MKMFDDMSKEEQNNVRMIHLDVDTALEYLHITRDNIINFTDGMVGGEFELESFDECLVSIQLAKEHLDRINTERWKEKTNEP